MLTSSPLYRRKAADENAGSDAERIDLIAEILTAIFGDKAESLMDGQKSFFSWMLVQKAWQAVDHPRGKNGRFIEKNSQEAVATAKQKIAATLAGKKTPEAHKELLEHLNILSVKQLHDLKREYKLSASGETKERLAAKLAERLGKGRTEKPEGESVSYKEWAKGERESNKKKQEVTNARTEETTDAGRQRPELERVDRGEPAGDAGPIAPRQNRILTDREQHTGKADLEKVPGHLREHLNDAQKFGVAKAIESLDKHGGFLLADGTGVGKTRQLLSVADKYARDGKKVVIVAPAEVIKPDWKKGSFGGSYSHDGEALGVRAKLSKGDAGLKGGEISLTTYNELGKLKDHIDKDTVVIFDESHAMKNSNSQRGKHGRDIGFNAGAVMYATATPADKPLHIAHLLRAGVFGGGDTNSKKFFGKAADTYQKLGLRQETIYNRHAGREITKWSVDPKVGHLEVARRISGLFDQMTKDGLMVQRSLSLDNVDSSIDHIQLPPEAHAGAKKAFDDAMAKDGNKAVALMAMRRAQEPHKIPAAVEHVKRELAAGRQPIIFLGRVNDNIDDEADDDDGAVDENTAKLLKSALIEAGIDEKHIGELHGAAATTADAKRRAMDHFQSGKTPILISTLQSGGTGVNLDDTVGNKPRSIVMMTPPLSGNDMLQAAGRINRLSTRSNARIISLVSDDPIDHWNMALLGKKMKTLGAVLGKGFESLTGGDEEQPKTPYDWGSSLVRKPIPTPLAKPTPVPSAANTTTSAAAPAGTPTRKVNTRNGERHVISWSPSKQFWDMRRAGKLPSSVGVGKNPRTGDWEATIWGESPEHANKVHDELKRMGAKSLTRFLSKSLGVVRALRGFTLHEIKSLEDHEIPEEGIDTQPYLEELADILGGMYGDKALAMLGGERRKSLIFSPLITKAERHEGETWQTGKFWYKREGGKTRRIRNPHGEEGGGADKRGQEKLSAPSQTQAGKPNANGGADNADRKPNARQEKQQAAIAGAKATIAKIKAGDRSPEAHKELMGHLGQMTLVQLGALRKEHGLKAPPKLKAQLVAKLAEHLHGGAGEAKPAEAAKPEAKPEAKTTKPIPTPLAKKPKPGPLSIDDADAKLKQLYDAAKDDSGIYEKADAFKPTLAKLSHPDLKRLAAKQAIVVTSGSKEQLVDRILQQIKDRAFFHSKTKVNPDENLG